MAFCKSCGTQVQDGVKFCPSCGAGIDTAQPAASAAPPQDPAQDAQNNKTMSILAYLLFFIPLLTGAHKTSPFVRYHTNQGTILFLATVAFSIVYGILNTVVTAIFLNSTAWGLWSIITTILSLLWLLPSILVIIGIYNAASGKMKPLPVIGRFTIIK